MWSLIFFVYIAGQSGVGITHLDNFISKRLCEKAAEQAIVHARALDVDKVKVDYSCVLEID